MTMGKTINTQKPMKSTNKYSKRDGPHETPQPLSDYTEGTRAPSKRAIRLAKLNESRARGTQACDEKKATANTSDRNSEETIDESVNRNVTLWPKVQTPTRRKSFALAFQPEQPHSGLNDLSTIYQEPSRPLLREVWKQSPAAQPSMLQEQQTCHV